jgi:hypothetical protein
MKAERSLHFGDVVLVDHRTSIVYGLIPPSMFSCAPISSVNGQEFAGMGGTWETWEIEGASGTKTPDEVIALIEKGIRIIHGTNLPSELRQQLLESAMEPPMPY